MIGTISLDGLFQLNVAERIQLLHNPWDSIVAGPETVSLTPGLRAELDCRLADLEQDPETGTPSEEVRARLLDRR